MDFWRWSPQLNSFAVRGRHREIRPHSFVMSRSILTRRPFFFLLLPFFPPHRPPRNTFATMRFPSILPAHASMCFPPFSLWPVCPPKPICHSVSLFARFSLSSTCTSFLPLELHSSSSLLPSSTEAQCLTRMNGSYLSCWKVQQAPVSV